MDRRQPAASAASRRRLGGFGVSTKHGENGRFLGKNVALTMVYPKKHGCFIYISGKKYENYVDLHGFTKRRLISVDVFVVDLQGSHAPSVPTGSRAPVPVGEIGTGSL